MGLSEMKQWVGLFLFVLNFIMIIIFSVAIFGVAILIIMLGYSPWLLVLAPIAWVIVFATGIWLMEGYE